MKLGEIIVHMDNYNFTKCQQNQMKDKKVLLIANLTDVSSVKVPLRSCKGAGEFGLCLLGENRYVLSTIEYYLLPNRLQWFRVREES